MSDLPLMDGFRATPHRFLWHEESASAIIADLHLGIEASLNAQGISFPETNLRSMRPAWKNLVDRLTNAYMRRGTARLIVAGDLFDSPSPPPRALAEAETLFADIAADIPIMLIRGNHDPAADELRVHFPAARFMVSEQATVGGYTIIHGDRFSCGGARPQGLIVGHQHPCVVLANRVESAKMICFASATVGVLGTRVPVILLPTFSRAPLGSNLRVEGHWILDLPRPSDDQIHIAGIVEGGRSVCVLEFGALGDL